MLILYQRLYLILLFLSGQSNHPLLAIYTSKLLSKPITSPCYEMLRYYYYIIETSQIQLFFRNKYWIILLIYAKYSIYYACET